MSGETEAFQSGWTVDTLRELILTLFRTQEKLLDERYATQTKALDAAFKAAEQAVSVALANAEKATVKAESAADRRFEAVNEFREALTDQTASFPTRNEVSVQMDALRAESGRNTARIADLELRLTSRLDLSQGSATGTREYRTDRLADDVYLQDGRIGVRAANRATISIAIAAASALVTVIAVIFAIVHG